MKPRKQTGITFKCCECSKDIYVTKSRVKRTLHNMIEEFTTRCIICGCNQYCPPIVKKLFKPRSEKSFNQSIKEHRERIVDYRLKIKRCYGFISTLIKDRNMLKEA